MYVLPLAAWIVQSRTKLISAREAMVGLGGRADRARVIEALGKLADLGPLRELARDDRKNAQRFFEWVEDPYWRLVEAYLAEFGVSNSPAEEFSTAPTAETLGGHLGP